MYAVDVVIFRKERMLEGKKLQEDRAQGIVLFQIPEQSGVQYGEVALA